MGTPYYNLRDLIAGRGILPPDPYQFIGPTLDMASPGTLSAMSRERNPDFIRARTYIPPDPGPAQLERLNRTGVMAMQAGGDPYPLQSQIRAGDEAWRNLQASKGRATIEPEQPWYDRPLAENVRRIMRGGGADDPGAEAAANIVGALRTIAPIPQTDIQGPEDVAAGGALGGVPRGSVRNAAGRIVRGAIEEGKYQPDPAAVTRLAEREGISERTATSVLRWRNYDKAKIEAGYGPLVPASERAPAVERMRLTPEAAAANFEQKRQEFAALPPLVWTPPPVTAFDYGRIRDAMWGFPDMPQTQVVRPVPKSPRVDLSHVHETWGDPANQAFIKQQAERGLAAGGREFYPSLWPAKYAAMDEGGISPATFNEWIYGITPSSAQSTINNEFATGNLLRQMHYQGIPFTKRNLALAADRIESKFGVRPFMSEGHAAGAARVLQQGIDPETYMNQGLTENFKVPTYGMQRAGNFRYGTTFDTHESGGQTFGSPWNPYFWENSGLGQYEYGPAEAYNQQMARELDVPGGSFQAGRWMGGGPLTGLKSDPVGHALDMHERQIAYTLAHQGIPPTRQAVRNYMYKLIREGGELTPWYGDRPIPDVRVR